MKVDPFAPQLLVDYHYFCQKFGPLPLGDFIALWHAADALMQTAVENGFEPEDMPDLLITGEDPMQRDDDTLDTVN